MRRTGIKVMENRCGALVEAERRVLALGRCGGRRGVGPAPGEPVGKSRGKAWAAGLGCSVSSSFPLKSWSTGSGNLGRIRPLPYLNEGLFTNDGQPSGRLLKIDCWNFPDSLQIIRSTLSGWKNLNFFLLRLEYVQSSLCDLAGCAWPGGPQLLAGLCRVNSVTLRISGASGAPACWAMGPGAGGGPVGPRLCP